MPRFGKKDWIQDDKQDVSFGDTSFCVGKFKENLRKIPGFLYFLGLSWGKEKEMMPMQARRRLVVCLVAALPLEALD